MRIIVTGLVALLYWQHLVPQWVLLAAVALGLWPLARIGIIDLFKHHRLGTEIFVSAATIIAVATGEMIAGALIMVIILIAEFIAGINTDRAHASIRGLIGAAPQTATRLRHDGAHETVAIAMLGAGDEVLVRAGEKIPVDGTVTNGSGSVNEAPITGESLPRDKSAGLRVFAGSILSSGAIDVRTEKVGDDTTFATIVRLVEQAQQHPAPVQKLTDRIAAWLVPVVLLFLGAVFLLTRDMRLIVTLLIFTSPAELGLATPLVMIAAIARAAREGILVKGGLYLEALARADVFVFDKTGTLTAGEPQVSSIQPAEGISRQLLLRTAAAADARSSHPLALAVVKAARDEHLEFPVAEDFQTLEGRGVQARVEGRTVLLGTSLLLRENGIAPPDSTSASDQAQVYVAAAGRFLGIVHFSDPPRPQAAAAIAQLRADGIRRIIMLTGDNESTAREIARQLGIDEVRANCLPGHKVEAINQLVAQGLRVAMVGDGINDAPALAAAHVGIAMGKAGTQAAIEAADIALMTDDLLRLVLARRLARRAYRTIKENLIFGIGVVHVAGITAALLRLIGPVAAALIHLGPDVGVFLNSIKLLRVRLPGANEQNMAARAHAGRPGEVGTIMRSLMLAAFIMLAGAVGARGQDAFDQPPISYSSAVAHDPVEKLKHRLASGEAKLVYAPRRGYLESVLKLLDIDASSQTLVFSKTSFQHQRISPDNPRAIYFNDDTYVGYVPGGEDLEIATTDPRLGPVFYMIEQTAPAPAGSGDLVPRQTANCLQCHAGSMTQANPGLIMRSTFPDSDGQPILPAGTFLTTLASPISQRWGGWLVTDIAPGQAGMGNSIYELGEDQNARAAGEVKLTNGADYLSRSSDALALMVLGAQTDLHNRFTRAVYQSELALRDEKVMADALGEKPPKGKHSQSTMSRIKDACEPLVRGLLYVDEAPPPPGLKADSDFARRFSARGPRTKEGRSLRDFDLKTRLFKYPCSYLIYSASFDQLPAAAKEYVSGRLYEVLSGKDQSEAFAKLTPADRKAVLQILRETKKDLAGHWGKAEN